MMNVLIAMLAVILVICASSLEWSITGRFFWVAILVSIVIVAWLLWWLSEKFIDLVDWMTQWEQ